MSFVQLIRFGFESLCVQKSFLHSVTLTPFPEQLRPEAHRVLLLRRGGSRALATS